MKIVIISDTHGMHEELGQLEGDLLIHCGDFEDVSEIDAWFAEQRFKEIIVIGGNHDHGAYEMSREGVRSFYNAKYLEDSMFEFEGLKIYGAPWVNLLTGWAYFRDEDELEAKWDLIPDDIDILVTHIPPFQILDKFSTGNHIGCSHLRARVEELENLRFHCFGHVHASYGTQDAFGVTFFNASNSSKGEMINAPIVVEF